MRTTALDIVRQTIKLMDAAGGLESKGLAAAHKALKIAEARIATLEKGGNDKLTLLDQMAMAALPAMIPLEVTSDYDAATESYVLARRMMEAREAQS